MKSNGIGYWNELKHMSRGLIIILLFVIFYSVFSVFYFNGGGGIYITSKFQLFLMKISDIMLYLFPAFLVFSLYQDIKREEILNKGLSYPVLLRPKFVVVLSAMLLTTVLMAVYSFTFNHFKPRADNRVIIHGLILIFCPPFIILSLISTAWGIMQFIKRNQLIRLILGMVIIITGFILYKWIGGLGFVSNIYRHFFFTLAIGTVYAFIGIILYERSGRLD